MNEPISTEKLTSEIREHWSFDQVQWIPLTKPIKLDFYDQWLKRGWNGEMEYLERHRPKKAEPSSLLAEAKSILVMTKSYVPVAKPHGKLLGLRIASYAQSEDYHDWFKSEIAESMHLLSNYFPNEHFRHGTDSDPVLERDYAVQAGLGWWGKNTCVIDRHHGSFSFIGEILSTVAVNTKIEPVHDFCGTCTKCMEICPTQAIEKARELNATKCISYWTIESKAIPPQNLREKFGDWFFGCDLCQSVCPWNSKPFRGNSVLETSLTLSTPHAQLKHDLEFLLTADDQKIKNDMKGTPLERARPKGLRRNALIVIANRRMKSQLPLVRMWLNDSDIGELAQWADQVLTASR